MMNNKSLVKLERIVNNLPIMKSNMERVEGKFGVIYLGFGESADGTPHGAWGYRDWGRPVEFKKGTSKEQVRQALVDDAAGFVALCHEKGLI